MKHQQFYFILAVLDALICLTTTPARAQFSFITNADNTITITGYTGSDGNVTIPSAINGYPVTSIGSYAFGGSTLTSVAISNSVTSIGNGAFEHCSALTDVDMDNSVTSIGEGAFACCSSLTGIDIPDSVTSISVGCAVRASLAGAANQKYNCTVKCP